MKSSLLTLCVLCGVCMTMNSYAITRSSVDYKIRQFADQPKDR